MARIWIFFAERTALSYLVLASLLLFGFGAALTIQRENAPEVQIPIAIISVALPGASPEDVESLIIEELERAVANLDDVQKLTSTSREGFGTVVVEFDARADIRRSIDKVKDAVDTVRGTLPEDATDPLVSEVNFADQPIMLLSVVSDLPVTEFRTLTKMLTDRIENVSGVSRAEVAGVQDREVTVVVRKESLALYGLTTQEITQAIRNNNVATPVGALEVDGIEYAVSFKSTLERAEEVAEIPVPTRSGPLRLGDIAFVADGVERQTTLSRVSIDGSLPLQAGTILVYKQRGADVTALSKNIRTLIDDLREEDAIDGDIVITLDSGEQIAENLTRLTKTGLQTVALVLLVLLAALGFREALTASLAIPLSFLTALMVMQATGNTLNFISLFSLILAIGILVDTAIVMTEGIHANMRQGLSKRLAVRQTIHDFHYPLTTGNLTTIAVFVPLFTLSGVTGQFIESIPFTVIAVLVSSLVISLAFIPVLARALLHTSRRGEGDTRQDIMAHRLGNWYRRTIPWFLDSRRRKVYFSAGLLLVLVTLMSFPFMGLIKVSFFPQSDVDWLYVNIREAQGTPLVGTELAVRTVEDELMTIPEVQSFTTNIGSGSPFDQSPESGPRFASVTVDLRPDRSRTSSEILTEIEERLSRYPIDARVFQPNEGPPSGAPVLVTFFGTDSDVLRELANDAADVLRTIPGTRVVSSSSEDDANRFTLTVDRMRASELGLSPALIASTLRTAVFGTVATTIKDGGTEIDVVVKLDLNTAWETVHDTNRATIDAIKELPIPTAQGTVLLGSVLSSSLESSSEVIRREDRHRITTASAEVAPGGVARDISAAFESEFLARGPLPEGVTMRLGGETEDINQSFQETFRALGIGIILVFAVLVIQFNRFRQAFIVLSVVPFSIIGVLLGLLVTREFLSFPAMLGFIALAGIVVNNAIILVDVFDRLRKERPDLPLRDVVIEGAARRLRPIILTAITTVVGVAPLIFVSALWRPIAISIMFGLLFAVALTLLLVPALYLKFCKRLPEDDDERLEHGTRPDLPAPTSHSLLTDGSTNKDTDSYAISPLLKSIVVVLLASSMLSVPSSLHAFTYDNDNIQKTYHEAPASFTVGEDGNVMGATVSGIPFRQYGIANGYGIRLHRFEIGLAHWYVSDRGIIWAENDLVALSIYLSRAS
jgi:multidrug efflux pump